MSKILVIVESPGKIKKIGEILGPNYIIKASFGHCQDLDSKTLSIEIDNNYNPYTDIKYDENGIIELTEEGSKLIEPIVKYFDERKEDSVEL